VKSRNNNNNNNALCNLTLHTFINYSKSSVFYVELLLHIWIVLLCTCRQISTLHVQRFKINHPQIQVWINNRAALLTLSAWCFDLTELMANLTCPEARTLPSLCGLWTASTLFSGQSVSPEKEGSRYFSLRYTLFRKMFAAKKSYALILVILNQKYKSWKGCLEIGGTNKILNVHIFNIKKSPQAN